jgi:hypothetical protein
MIQCCPKFNAALARKKEKTDMAYLGEVNLQEFLAKNAPNHPFAHSQISFGVKPPVSTSGKSKTPNKPVPSANPLLAAESAEDSPQDNQQTSATKTPPAESLKQDSEGNSLFLMSPENHHKMVEQMRAEFLASRSAKKSSTQK